MMRNDIPKNIMYSFELEEDDVASIEAFLEAKAEHKVYLRQPERGQFRTLCDTVVGNAEEKVKQIKETTEHDESILIHLAEILGLETVPERIEAYDISNIGSENITAGMVVCESGKLKKSDYRVFKIKNQIGADDYSAMREVIRRRLEHLSDPIGSFSNAPDLILLDGGKTHVGAVKEVLSELNIDIPVFGMVKDEHHKTRTIVNEYD
jgi:excinuclease ABC subunit C